MDRLKFADLKPHHFVAEIKAGSDPDRTGYTPSWRDADPAQVYSLVEKMKPDALIIMLPGGVNPRNKEMEFSRVPANLPALEALCSLENPWISAVYMGFPDASFTELDDGVRMRYSRSYLAKCTWAKAVRLGCMFYDGSGDWSNMPGHPENFKIRKKFHECIVANSDWEIGVECQCSGDTTPRELADLASFTTADNLSNPGFRPHAGKGARLVGQPWEKPWKTRLAWNLEQAKVHGRVPIWQHWEPNDGLTGPKWREMVQAAA